MPAQRAFEGRLIALASAHNLLTQLNWEHASLEQIARVVLNVTGDGSGRIRLPAPVDFLPPKEALSVTMALHELCTNAMKYGALSNDAGHIDVEWTRSLDSRPRLDLMWRESGGPPVSRPGKGGFGSRLLERSLAFDLDGEVRLSFEPSGLVCRFTRRYRRAGHPPMNALSGKRVLVVEDEAMIADMVEDMLSQLGAVVGPAGTLAKGLELARSEVLDAAMLDVNIRSERIDPMVEVLRARAVPFVFATGYGDAIGAAMAGVNILEKPVYARQNQERIVKCVAA